ncbi:MAG: hypothetical protein P8L85_08740 [Rubripirellula sp.]|nr:hypothetical protein [Rubripirellula sp.]
MAFCCLLVGLIAGQSGVLDLAAPSDPVASLRLVNDSAEMTPVSLDDSQSHAETLVALPTAMINSDLGLSATAPMSAVASDLGSVAALSEPVPVASVVAPAAMPEVADIHEVTWEIEKAVVRRTREAAAYIGEQWLLAKQSVKPEVDPLMSLPSSEPLSVEQLPVSDTGICRDGACQEPENRLGTTIHWSSEPKDAYRIAEQQDKLVFLIHVSGNFKIPGFT